MDGKQEEISNNISAYITINTKVFVTPLYGENAGIRYDSRIDDIDGDTIIIAIPTENGLPVPLSRGAKISISSWTEKGRIGFDTSVLGIYRGHVMALRIAMPKKLYRVQLREFFRVNTFLKVKVYMSDLETLTELEKNEEEFDSLEITMSDISGGGCRFTTEEVFEKDTVIVVDFANTPLSEIRRLECEIIRAIPEEQRFKVSVNFLSVTPFQRKVIIRYVFKRQIELKDIKNSDI